MKKRSLIVSLCLALAMMFTFNSMAFAAETTLDTENMVLSDSYTESYTDENGNFITATTKIYTGENGLEVEETTRYIFETTNGIMPYASGNVTKDVTHEVKEYSKKLYRIYIWGKFSYNGTKATVVDASWNTRILSEDVYEEMDPQGGSGTNALGTAQIYVKYKIGDTSNDHILTGTKTLECNKNGN